MAKILETTDKTLAAKVKAVQDERGGATIGGKRRNGAKVNPATGKLEEWAPGHPLWIEGVSQWRGVEEVYALETDDKDPALVRLALTQDVEDAITSAKAKPDKDRTDDEKDLAKVDAGSLKVASVGGKGNRDHG
jgi:hypothetical protein